MGNKSSRQKRAAAPKPEATAETKGPISAFHDKLFAAGGRLPTLKAACFGIGYSGKSTVFQALWKSSNYAHEFPQEILRNLRQTVYLALCFALGEPGVELLDFHGIMKKPVMKLLEGIRDGRSCKADAVLVSTFLYSR